MRWIFPQAPISARQLLPGHGAPTRNCAASSGGTVLASQPSMPRLSRSFLLALPMAVAFAVTAAKADFYTLDGRFQCLERPGAVCYDATVSRVPSVLAPSSPAPIEPAVTAKAAAVAPPPPAPFVPAVPAKPPAPSRTSALTQPPRDPILMIAARIKAERPAPDDLAVLRRAALHRASCVVHAQGDRHQPRRSGRLFPLWRGCGRRSSACAREPGSDL